MPNYWCWLHNRPRTGCGPDGVCPTIEKMAAEYRAERDSGKTVRFNIERLRRNNASATSSRDLERSIVESAKEEGRELARPSDYPHL